MDARTVFIAEAGAQVHWERLKLRISVPAASTTFFVLALAAIVSLSLGSKWCREFYYAVNRAVNYSDMHELNEYGDYVLQEHLAGSPNSGRECVLLGASYTACSNDPDPRDRLQGPLGGDLEARAPGPIPWEVTNLATNGYDTWSLFYVTRLLRMHRRPDVLIVSLDILRESDRSVHLFLDVPPSDAEFTKRELEPVVPLNNQLLYVSEARLQRVLRDHLPGFKAFAFLSTSYPKKENIRRWLEFTAAYLQGKQANLEPPANRHADGTHKSWQELPEARRIMERRIKTGSVIPQPSPAARHNLELLGTELAAIQAAGTQVIVVTMPRNPVVPLDPNGVDVVLDEWAERHGLEFHNYWTSGLIPTEDYVDTGHFLKGGSEIMAREIADLVYPDATSGEIH